MKRKITLIGIACLIFEGLFGQNLVAVTSWGNTKVGEDDLLYRININEPVSFLDNDQEVVVSTQPIILFTSIADTTSTHQIEALNGITAFPNPSPGIVNVNREVAEENYYINIISEDGKIIRRMTWHEGNSIYQVSLQSFPQGLYLLNVYNEDLTRHQCFKIQKK